MGMPRGGQDLLTQIERDALDEGVPLAATLRKCIALGAQARNADLRDWASQELDGYRDGGIPEYRTIYVPLLIDALTFTHQIRGQQISATDLPDFAQDVISEELRLGQSVGDLDALARNARNAGKASVKMSPPGSAELLKLWNCARAYNADPARLLTVTEIVVFGSYLDPAVDLLGDLDLAVSTAVAPESFLEPQLIHDGESSAMV